MIAYLSLLRALLSFKYPIDPAEFPRENISNSGAGGSDGSEVGILIACVIHS
jgi:hypothetical protein